MELTRQQYEKIKDSLPLQRGNVRLSNLEVLNAILYVAEQGCKWRGLLGRFVNWHTIYVRMNRWAKNGVLDRMFEKLQLNRAHQDRGVRARLDFGKGAPGWHWRVKKTDRRRSASPGADGTPRFIWLPRMLERP